MISDALSSLKIQVISRPCGLRGLQFSPMQEEPAGLLESCFPFEVLSLSNEGIDPDPTSAVLEIWHPLTVSSCTHLPIPHKIERQAAPTHARGPNRTNAGLSVGAGKGKQLKQHSRFPSSTEKNN